MGRAERSAPFHAGLSAMLAASATSAALAIGVAGAHASAGGDVVYGGHRLGPAPAGSGEGWASDAFRSWLSASGQ